jgi:hypothetical protein
MKKFEDSFYKKFFFLGSLWNVGIGLIGLLFYNFAISFCFGSLRGADNLITKVFFKFFMVAVLLFGFGYYLVSKELTLNRGIIWLGIAGKLIIWTTFTFLFFTNRATILGFLGASGDFFWSLIFIYFLWQTKDNNKINNIIG